MLFWILTAVIVGVWLFVTIREWMDWGFGDALVPLVAGGLLAGVAWILVPLLGVGLGLSHLLGANGTESTIGQLRALGSGAGVEGSFFLGSGHVDGKRVLSYIAVNDDGSFTPDQVDASASKVWEVDGVDPSMVTHELFSDRWWLVPGRVPVSESYEFMVPLGSVAESYEVAP